MLIDYRDLWQRLREAQRSDGLRGGLWSWIKELRRDYAWTAYKAAAIQQDRSELDARAALLVEAKAVFLEAVDLPETGLTAARKRRRAAREIGTLASAALKLESQDKEFDDLFVRIWRRAAIDFVDHPQQPKLQRNNCIDELALGFRALSRYGTEYRREQDRMRELGW